MVSANIALKDGDYPGTKNVTRMKNAILNQVAHCNNQEKNLQNGVKEVEKEAHGPLYNDDLI